MAISDPTKTLSLRARACSESNARFERVRREVIKALSLGDHTGEAWPWPEPIVLDVPKSPPIEDGILIANMLKKKPKKGYVKPKRISSTPSILGPESTPTGYVFQQDVENLARFQSFIDKLIDKEILQPGVPLSKKWLNKYVGSSYDKGTKVASASVKAKLKKAKLTTPSNVSSFANPAHLERAKFIYARTFNDLKGVTETMKSQMTHVLTEGMMKGTNPKVIGDLLGDRVAKIGKTRGRLIARTEIIRAHQEAAISEAEELEQESGYSINVEWHTCLDGRERETHHARHGKIYTKERARTLLGEPNCRCSVMPHISLA